MPLKVEKSFFLFLFEEEKIFEPQIRFICLFWLRKRKESSKWLLVFCWNRSESFHFAIRKIFGRIDERSQTKKAVSIAATDSDSGSAESGSCRAESFPFETEERTGAAEKSRRNFSFENRTQFDGKFSRWKNLWFCFSAGENRSIFLFSEFRRNLSFEQNNFAVVRTISIRCFGKCFSLWKRKVRDRVNFLLSSFSWRVFERRSELFFLTKDQIFTRIATQSSPTIATNDTFCDAVSTKNSRLRANREREKKAKLFFLKYPSSKTKLIFFLKFSRSNMESQVEDNVHKLRLRLIDSVRTRKENIFSIDSTTNRRTF